MLGYYIYFSTDNELMPKHLKWTQIYSTFKRYTNKLHSKLQFVSISKHTPFMSLSFMYGYVSQMM